MMSKKQLFVCCMGSFSLSGSKACKVWVPKSQYVGESLFCSRHLIYLLPTGVKKND